MSIKIVIADDHTLLSKALAEFIEAGGECEVLYSVATGRELTERFQSPKNIPDLVLLDINMPVMNGFETAEWLREHHPGVKVLALSMNNKEADILKMLKAGARGYLLKDSSPSELHQAIAAVMEKGFYHSELVTQPLLNLLRGGKEKAADNDFGLNGREKEFLRLACSDLSYKQIADIMCLSERTIDGYRESVFVKMDVKTRTAMAVKAIRLGIVDPEAS